LKIPRLHSRSVRSDFQIARPVPHKTWLGDRIGGTTLIASDECEEGAKIEGFYFSLTVTTEAEANRAFDALAEGGQLWMPLTKIFGPPGI
jgi:hypothetical protein